MEQETKVKIEQAMELADKFEKGYEAGVYDTKNKILRWAMEHKKAIEANGDEDDAFERGEYSVLNALIDEIRPELTKFEEKVKELIGSYPIATEENKGDLIYEVRKKAKELLELAKKEIYNRCIVILEQYCKGL